MKPPRKSIEHMAHPAVNQVFDKGPGEDAKGEGEDVSDHEAIVARSEKQAKVWPDARRASEVSPL